MLQEERLRQIRERFEFVSAALATGEGDIAQMGREFSELRPVVERIEVREQLRSEQQDAEEMRSDPEMSALAEEELSRISQELEALEASLRREMLPKNADDARPAILEIRPGTGGDEAALFAGDLLRMYMRFAERCGWRFETLELSESDLGGIREAVARIEGENVFARMKYESGVHRVQRVPETESGGRIHTSAATVAVLPEAEDISLDLDPGELRIDTMRASGAGGQHVNTTDSAVRITHLPTGIVVTSSEKSQHQNRANAMAILKARLLDMQKREADESRAADRRAQIGGGDRSERIRTYNFPQGRITDHRIGLTLYKLAAAIDGDLNEIIDVLTLEDETRRLAELGL